MPTLKTENPAADSVFAKQQKSSKGQLMLMTTTKMYTNRNIERKM